MPTCDELYQGYENQIAKGTKDGYETAELIRQDIEKNHPNCYRTKFLKIPPPPAPSAPLAILGAHGERLHGGPFCIVNAESGRVLGVDRDGSNGDAVHVSPYTGSRTQQWLLERMPNEEWNGCPYNNPGPPYSGLYHFINVQSGRVLDADKPHRAENGCKVMVWDRQSEKRSFFVPFPNMQQVWWMQHRGDCKYQIASLLDLGVAMATRHLDAARSELNQEFCKVQLWTPWVGENQLWYFYPATGDSAFPVQAGSNTAVNAAAAAAAVVAAIGAIHANTPLAVIGTDHRVYRWNGSGWEGDSAGGAGTDLAVGPGGQVFMLNARANNSIWRHDGDRWTQLPGAALDVAVGGDGSLFVIGTDYRVYRWNGSGWDGDSAGGSGTKIAVGPTGQAFVVNAGDHGSIWRRDGGGWTRLPGAALDLAVGDDGSVFVIGTDHKIYRWNGSGWEGDSAGGAGTALAVSPSGQVFVLNASVDNTLWCRTNTGWIQIPGAALALGA